MSGELQSVPARHGTATFVPKGQTIKIINTYGQQVVDTWIFRLHDAPDHGADEEVVEAARDSEEETRTSKGKTIEEGAERPNENPSPPTDDRDKASDDGEHSISATEKASDTIDEKQPSSSKAKATWSSYIPSTSSLPSLRRKPQPSSSNDSARRAWSSYFPSGVAYSSYLPNKSTLSAFAQTHARDPTKSYAEQLHDFSKTPVGAASLSAASGSGTASSVYAAYTAYARLAPSLSTSPPMEYLSLAHTRAATHSLVIPVGSTLYSNLRNPLMNVIEDTTGAPHNGLLPACDASWYASRERDGAKSKGGKGSKEGVAHGSCAENLVLALNELNEKAGLKGRKAVGADVTVNSAPGPLHLFMNTTLRPEDPRATDGHADSEEPGIGSPGRGEIHIQPPQCPKRSFVRLRAERDVVVVMSACPDDTHVKPMAANFVVEPSGSEPGSEQAGQPGVAREKSTEKGAGKSSDVSTPKSPEKGAGKSSDASTPKSRPQAQRAPSSTAPSRTPESPARRPSNPPHRPSEPRRPSNPPRKLSQQASRTSTPTLRKGYSQPMQGGTEKEGQATGRGEEPAPGGREEDITAPAPKKKPKKLERRSTSTVKS